MPKKSNKTAHVLSLLTNGGGDLSGENENVIVAKPEVSSNEPTASAPPEVVVELQGSNPYSSLSDLVKSDLEKELVKELAIKDKSSGAISKHEDIEKDVKNAVQETVQNEQPISERPPYSPTFMAKFGINPTADEPEELPATLADVKSVAYVLEDFNDEEENETMSESTIVTEEMKGNTESTKILHNIVEDVIKMRVPEIMKSLNMCCCQDCVYDVMALALNHLQPLYTVTEKGQLFQKLISYETQNGTDLTAQVTKACIKVQANPYHNGNDANRK